MINYSIEYALRFFPTTNIWVNTDDDEIIRNVSIFPINILKRPPELAMDHSSSAEVLQFQLNYFRENKIDCDAIILLQPTNPLRNENLLFRAIELFEKSARESLATFSTLNRKIGFIKSDYYYPDNYFPGQRMQDIIPSYYENGSIYISKNCVINRGQIISEDVFPMINDDIFSRIDIDEPEDMILAEFVLKSTPFQK